MLKRGFWFVASFLLLEILIFAISVRFVGFLPTIAIILGTTIGAALAKEFIADRIKSEFSLRVAITLLLVPLPISTIVGVLGLVPPIRRYAEHQVIKTPLGSRISRIATALRDMTQPGHRSDVIDVDAVEDDEGVQDPKLLPGD